MAVMSHMLQLMGTIAQTAGIGNKFNLAFNRLPDGGKSIKITVYVLINNHLIHTKVLILFRPAYGVYPAYA